MVADPWHSDRCLARIEPLAALEGRLPAIVKGGDHPRDVRELLDLAQICHNKKLYATSARFWGDALDEDPKIVDDRRLQHRYNAACSAAPADSGRGKDDPAPDQPARAELRRKALRWLDTELTAWTDPLDSPRLQARGVIAQTMQHWKNDAELAAVRDADALARLPAVERNDWQALREQVDALARMAGETYPWL